ncbi:MAG: carboxylating nicotinate-nucleotide diphosphorylase [Porticoccaceae bacterium]|jgi:nicotinate-nucleotide pyrophosphorylase (carboxylating)|nr:carboxylating nicotinate-nucleotide diphosphorylase [Porticoccaceae bacterium]
MPTQNQFSADLSDYLVDLSQAVALALQEDIRSGDVNAALVPETRDAEAHVIARESGVVCGLPWFNEVFAQLDPDLQIEWLVEDGDEVEADQQLVRLNGSARTLLTGERTALNFLQLLSGTATESRKYAEALADHDITILDTRKTIPGLRLAQKYAVRIGGCQNHRIGLYDAYLIKENHILACGSISAAVSKAREDHPNLPVEVETENLEEVKEALSAGADRIMLDNFDAGTLRQAVDLIDGKAQTEISGGIALEDLVALNLQGIDFLSSGALTKHVKALDLSMRIQLIN